MTWKRPPFATLALGVLAGCSSPSDRPPVSHLPPRDAGPVSDAADVVPPEDPGAPLPSPDLVFVLPYLGPSDTADLEFTVGVRALDVHFSVDTTGSFGGEIDELQRTLLDVVLPGIRDRVADASFGVSRFEDFPVSPFGGVDDRPFDLLQRQTLDDARAEEGVRRLDNPLGQGGDFPEANAEALYQIATGEGFVLNGARIVSSFRDEDGIGALGGVGFRADALPIVIQVTDAPPHQLSEYAAIPGAHSTTEVDTAIAEAGLRVLGIASGGEARPYLRRMARATGAVSPADGGECPMGVGGEPYPAGNDDLCPLVYDIDPEGGGLSGAIVGAVEALLDAIVFDTVSVEIRDDELGFVVEATPLDAEVPAGTAPPGLADLLPPGGDGVLDSFTAVHQGTRLRFRLALQNRVVRETDYEQIFFLRARIVADGRTVLDDKLLQVTVPARTPAPEPDAGIDADPRAVDAGLDAGLDAGA